ISTDEVFGSLGPEGTFSEESPYAPNSPYAASKAASDHLVRAWGTTYGLPVIVSNCSNNYGPYQFPEKLIPVVILNALRGRPIPIYGQGENVRDWLFVEDHADALLTILRHGQVHGTYNVGGNAERRNIDLVRDICAVMDRLRPSANRYADLITFVQDRPGHDARYAIDASQLQNALGWSPKVDLNTGLERTVAWYLDNEAWWSALEAREGVGERLGLIE
ncbi:MAG: GDP-mannose 4,6-dehydratase, partial [Pseudomonadota bacterium]